MHTPQFDATTKLITQNLQQIICTEQAANYRKCGSLKYTH